MKIFLSLIIPVSCGVFLWGLVPDAAATPAPAAVSSPSPTVVPSPSPSPTPTGAVDVVAEFGQSPIDFTWLFLKTIFAMIVVIALAIVVLRYIIPRIGLHRKRGVTTDIHIVDRVPLEAKKMLYIIEVEGRRLLIGSSEHQMNLIAELERSDERQNS
jgi:flagellar biogenesis protein FliO